MIKILFVIQEYTQGGINKCLENMLGILDPSKYEIFIYSLYEDGGEYYKEVFSKHIVKKSLLYKYSHDHVLTRKIMGLYNKLTKRYNFGWLYKYEAKYLQKKYNFDVVVAYHEGMTVEFASYFKNTRKITWFHCDPAVLGKDILEEYRKCYFKMDDIVCVSNVVKDSLCKLAPDYNGKIHVIHNLLDIDFVRKQSCKENVEYNSGVFRIISIGRSAKIKQFELIPIIVRQVLNIDAKIKFEWRIISSGHECDADIKKAIMENNVEKYVKILGEKSNPYPDIKCSQLLVSTSASEAYPTVVNEAQILGVPVITNNFPSAFEIVAKGCGLICSIEDMHIYIYNLIINKDGVYDLLQNKVRKFGYDNSSICQKLNEMFA